ncbi:MAG: hypothetical protein HC772_15710 [Leptolyngbyaceae cyanobacterium CRU_2_3]|nr:hypothetical protein [Leptolyngbyaceae cyanobacterium CRU_2_3]
MRCTCQTNNPQTVAGLQKSRTFLVMREPDEDGDRFSRQVVRAIAATSQVEWNARAIANFVEAVLKVRRSLMGEG